LGIPLKETEATLAEILEVKGYTTAAFIASYVLTEEISGLQHGFNYYYADFPPRVKGTTFKGKFNPLVEKRADTLTDSMLHWLEENYKSKFFIWAHYMDPHAPYDPPSPHDKMYSELKHSLRDFNIEPHLIHYQAKIESKQNFLYYLSRYYGEISFCDEQLGRLLHFLRLKNLYRNSIIIITADHGESMGEHERFFSHGHNLYQENVCIPLIISFPMAIKTGKKIEIPVNNIDIVPTILKLLKIEPSKNVQGEDLLAFINGQKKKRKEPILIQAYAGDGWALIQDKWKFIYQQKGRNYQLFDLSQDPKEQENLSRKYPTIANNMASHIHGNAMVTVWASVAAMFPALSLASILYRRTVPKVYGPIVPS